MDSESTIQVNTDGAGEVKAEGIVCRPDGVSTRKSHLGGEKSIIVHKYYRRYQPTIHNRTIGCLGTKRENGDAKGKAGDGMSVGIY